MAIHDVTGRRVLYPIQNQWMDAGKYIEKMDAACHLLMAGVYIVELNINGKIQTYKLIHSP
jgi:hypothetical protein